MFLKIFFYYKHLRYICGMETKVCSKCKVEKPLNIEFFYYYSKRNNFRTYCIKCSREYNKKYYRNNIEKEQKRHREYYINNSEKCIERVKNYIENNYDIVKEKWKLYRKNYRINNPEKCKLRDKKKYEKNREIILIRLKKYHSRLDVKERKNQIAKQKRKTDDNFIFNCKIMKHIRSVEKRNDFKTEWDEVKDVYNMYGIDYHIDHKVPKSWFKSSTPKNIVNDIRNLQVIDAEYNLSKLNKWADKVSDEYSNLIKPYLKKAFLDKII